MVSPENFSKQFSIMYHVTSSDNRKSIEKHGLKANGGKFNRGTGHTNGEGVFVDFHPHTSYGDDIWAITNVPLMHTTKYTDEFRGKSYYRTGKYDPIDDAREGDVLIPKDVEPQDIKRVGHVTNNNEIHWHKEEDCRNG